MAIIGDREPFGTRESLVKAEIAKAFGGRAHTAINSAEMVGPDPGDVTVVEVLGSVALSDSLINRLHIKATMRQALTYTQYMVLWYRFAKGETQEHTAQHFHLGHAAVREIEATGLQQLVRVLFDDPTYQTPPRVRKEPTTRFLTLMARFAALEAERR